MNGAWCIPSFLEMPVESMSTGCQEGCEGAWLTEQEWTDEAVECQAGRALVRKWNTGLPAWNTPRECLWLRGRLPRFLVHLSLYFSRAYSSHFAKWFKISQTSFPRRSQSFAIKEQEHRGFSWLSWFSQFSDLQNFWKVLIISTQKNSEPSYRRGEVGLGFPPRDGKLGGAAVTGIQRTTPLCVTHFEGVLQRENTPDCFQT